MSVYNLLVFIIYRVLIYYVNLLVLDELNKVIFVLKF